VERKGWSFLPGKIKKMIDEIIQQRSKGNPAITEMTIAKLILKGINPNKFDINSPDDMTIINKLLDIARQLNVNNLDNIEKSIRSSSSSKITEEDAVKDINNQQKISLLMEEEFKGCIVIGCSTAGELASGEMLDNSIVAMAINSNIISDIKVELVENIKKNLNLELAFTSFEEYYKESLYNMSSEKFVGITLIDGLSMKEEKIMDLIGDRTNVFFVGGSAADNNEFVETYVSVNGYTSTDSVALILIRISDDAEFSVIKTQSFESLDYSFVANKVDEEKRQVIEFNNRPAALEYADAVKADNIEEISKYFMSNPLGLMIEDNDFFIRSPQRVIGTSMMFYCNILEGMEVKLLKATNIIDDTRRTIENKASELGKIDGIINFQCIHRTLELKKKNLSDEYAKIFKDIPTIGFSAYGEQYIGHINDTSTMLIFNLKSGK
jgi:hypothetical protein